LQYLGDQRIDGGTFKPEPAKFAQGIFNPTGTMAINSGLEFELVDAVGPLSGYVSGSQFTVPIAGTYSISGYFGICSPTTDARVSFFVKVDFKNGLPSQIVGGFSDLQCTLRTQLISTSITLDKGAIISFYIWNGPTAEKSYCNKLANDSGDNVGPWWNITLVEQMVPAIVADSKYVRSNYEPGGVAIDSQTGEMTVNDAVINWGLLPAGTDLNTVVQSGTYELNGAYPNHPYSNMAGFLKVTAGVTNIIQEFRSNASVFYTCSRTFTSIWSAWIEHAFAGQNQMFTLVQGDSASSEYYEILNLPNPTASGATTRSCFYYYLGCDNVVNSYAYGLINVRIRGTGSPVTTSISCKRNVLIAGDNNINMIQYQSTTDASGSWHLAMGGAYYVFIGIVPVYGTIPSNLGKLANTSSPWTGWPNS
jgi:hypothetical protein